MNQLAKRLVDVATGDEAEEKEAPNERRARKGGKSGGPARAKRLTPERRSEIARVAARARWKQKED